MNKKRILIIASLAISLIRFRGDFIKSLLKNGFEVFTAAPSYTDQDRVNVTRMGATIFEFNLQRTGLNPIKDFKSILELKAIIKDNNIDLSHKAEQHRASVIDQ